MRNLFFVVAFLFVTNFPANAELKPAQLGLVVNEKSPESIELASYYAAKRGIPENNILKVFVDTTDSISRTDYEEKVVKPIRKQLEAKGLANSVRLLVTFYGVPLKVAPIEPNDDEKLALAENGTAANEAILRLREIVTETAAAQGSKVDPNSLTALNFQDLVNRAAAGVKEFGERQGKAVTNKEEEKNFKLKLQTYIMDISGLAGLSQSIQVTDPNSEAGKELEKLKADILKGREILMSSDRLTAPKYRKISMALTQRLFGAIGVLQRATAFSAIFSAQESDAALDSELTLLWWDRGQYQAAAKIPSPFDHRNLKSPTPPLLKILPALMTARLDGSTAAVVKRMIDDSIATEATGLKGEFYIDARGMKPDATELSKFDQKLRDLGWMIREDSKMSVEVENTEFRLSKPGDATNVALYIGWYKLRDYEDGFKFNPGSVGFHVASEEAADLHDPSEKGWCKNALDRGLGATLGAVAEPYLDAFPHPIEFYGLLMTGRYSLAETYFLTEPYLSWRIILIGDPLYNPFKNNPQVKDEAFAKRSESGGTLNPFPPSPADREFPNPIAGHKIIKEEQLKAEKQLDSLKLQ